MSNTEKLSLTRARQDAKEKSALHPKDEYYVMDKEDDEAVCACSEWVRRQLMLNGYVTVASYQNGKLMASLKKGQNKNVD